MIGSNISPEILQECISNLDELKLRGMELLKASSQKDDLAAKIDREIYKGAVLELIDYNKACRQTAYDLSQLEAIAIAYPEQWTFGL